MAGVPLAGGLVGYRVLRRGALLRAPAGAGARRRPGAASCTTSRRESLLVFDHLTRGVALLHAGTERERQALRREVISALRGGCLDAPAAGASSRRADGEPDRSASSSQASQRTQGVHRGRRRLSARAVGALRGPHCDLDPFEAYRALRLLNPSPYMYYCELGDVRVVGSSPEALVKLDGRTRAAAADRRHAAARRGRAEDDVALESELLADPKENAEHVMLVDLARNDLGRVAQRRHRARRSVSRRSSATAT